MTDLDHDLFHIVGKHSLMFNIWSGEWSSVHNDCEDVWCLTSVWGQELEPSNRRLRVQRGIVTKKHYWPYAHLDNSEHRHLIS